MYSLEHIICCYLVIIGVLTEGLPRYRRQNFGQYASQLSLNIIPLGELNLGAQANGNINDFNNYNITGQGDLNLPIYNGGPNNPSVDLGAVAGISFGSYNGQFFGPKPNYDAGLNVHIPFGRR